MFERLRRVPGLARATKGARELEAHDEWDAERLAAYQRQRLLAIVRHAAENSSFYRERFAGIELSDDLDPSELPTLDKATMLDHFDDLVTDSRLNLAGVESHLEEVERADPGGDPMLLGEYRAMASSGSSGQRGVFVYGREDWREVLAGAFRVNNFYLGLAPRLPRRRIATIWAESPLHISGRVARSFDVGVHRFLRLDARTSLDELVQTLNSYRPTAISAYASVAAQLAECQLAGSLHIAPEVVSTTAEVRTPDMEERIVVAWELAPFNFYSTSETGVVACECDRHAGMHMFGDLALIEVVGDDYRPVPAGKSGNRVLVTNLFNRTQPLIRYELTDLVTISPDPCPCGRPFPLIASLDGRSDDVLEMPDLDGGTVEVHPLTIRSPLAGIGALREYRVIHTRGDLRVEAVLAAPDGGGADASAQIRDRLRAALEERGAKPPPIRVEPVDRIPPDPRSGKRRLIESR
ncbi:MAG: hypothetical protein WD404_01260 [Solirubrobacterales bacterium]